MTLAAAGAAALAVAGNAHAAATLSLSAGTHLTPAGSVLGTTAGGLARGTSVEFVQCASVDQQAPVCDPLTLFGAPGGPAQSVVAAGSELAVSFTVKFRMTADPTLDCQTAPGPPARSCAVVLRDATTHAALAAFASIDFGDAPPPAPPPPPSIVLTPPLMPGAGAVGLPAGTVLGLAAAAATVDGVARPVRVTLQTSAGAAVESGPEVPVIVDTGTGLRPSSDDNRCRLERHRATCLGVRDAGGMMINVLSEPGAVGLQTIRARIDGPAGAGIAPATATMNVLPVARSGRTFNVLDATGPTLRGPGRPASVRSGGSGATTPLRGGAHLPMGSSVRTGSSYVSVYAADAAARQHSIFNAYGSWVLRRGAGGRTELATAGPLRCGRGGKGRSATVVGIAGGPFFSFHARLGAVVSYTGARPAFTVSDLCDGTTSVTNFGRVITVRVASTAKTLRMRRGTSELTRACGRPSALPAGSTLLIAR